MWIETWHIQSQPVRGVWIETAIPLLLLTSKPSRNPYGVCGLKLFTMLLKGGQNLRRNPYGVCGLKLWFVFTDDWGRESQPVRGVWIETERARQ